ncbi:MAG: MFS transporter, partial [Hungatella sp.]
VISSFMTIGNFVGCLLIPFIAGRIGKNKPVLIVCAAMGALGAAFAWSAPQGILLIAALFLTGSAISGMIPLLMPIPILLKEIGPEYGGTAGGFVCTIQLLGTVVIPSYIIAPITGTNMVLYYILCGLCVVMSLVLVFFLPDFGAKAVAKNAKAKPVSN